MAKAFYSIDEVCKLLGKTQDQIKQLVRDGSLREFRDAGKIFFRADDVSKLAGHALSSEDSGELTLEPAEAGASTGADSEGTSVIGLEVVEEAERPPTTAGERATVISASGIGVFDDDELEIAADPMAETQITTGAAEDQVSLEGSGSGSGLLDLTREADDTSLGAELLDEIYPGEEEAAQAAAPAAVAEAPAEEAEPERAAVAAPAAVAEAPAVYAGAADPMEGLFSGLMIGALLLLAAAGSVVAGTLQGFLPDYARFLSSHFWPFIGAAAFVPVLALLLGWVVGKAALPRRT